MAPRREFEVVVIEADGPIEASDESVAEPDEGASHLRRQLARLERLIHDVESVAVNVRDFNLAGEEYPLAEALIDAGCSITTVRQLATGFAMASAKGPRNFTSAVRHLHAVLRTTSATHWSHVRGEHWFYGRAGVGRTTMVLHLAATLRREGMHPAIICVGPRHEGDLQRIQSAAKALDVSAAAVFEEDDLDQARQHFADRDVVLVDTPCFLTYRPPSVRRASARRHLVVPLAEDPVLLRECLGSQGDWRPDTMAITQIDICPRPGHLLDLVREIGAPLSFLQRFEGGLAQVELADSERLVGGIFRPEPGLAPTTASAAPEAMAAQG